MVIHKESRRWGIWNQQHYLYYIDLHVASAATRALLCCLCAYFLKVIDSFCKAHIFIHVLNWVAWIEHSLVYTQITVAPLSTIIWNLEVAIAVLNWVKQTIQKQVLITFCQRQADKNLAVPWTVIREHKYEMFNVWVCFLKKKSLFRNSLRSSTEEIRLPDRVTIPSLVFCFYCFIQYFKSTFL